jgi:hypothetical protein
MGQEKGRELDAAEAFDAPPFDWPWCERMCALRFSFPGNAEEKSETEKQKIH